MIYREIFPDTEPARDYAVRMSKSDAQPYSLICWIQKLMRCRKVRPLCWWWGMTKPIQLPSCLPARPIKLKPQNLPHRGARNNYSKLILGRTFC